MWTASYVAISISWCFWGGGFWLTERQAPVSQPGTIRCSYRYGGSAWSRLLLASFVAHNPGHPILNHVSVTFGYKVSSDIYPAELETRFIGIHRQTDRVKGSVVAETSNCQILWWQSLDRSSSALRADGLDGTENLQPRLVTFRCKNAGKGCVDRIEWFVVGLFVRRCLSYGIVFHVMQFLYFSLVYSCGRLLSLLCIYFYVGRPVWNRAETLRSQGTHPIEGN